MQQRDTAITPSGRIADDRVELQGGLNFSPVGIGAWSWGDSLFWKYDAEMETDAQKAFDAAVDSGINFFDTAEVYGAPNWGLSEKLCGKFAKQYKGSSSDTPAIATKFAPVLPRMGRQAVVKALKESNERMGVDVCDLYQLHWPGFFLDSGFWDGLADACDQGLVKAVGVSNYSEKRLRNAHKALKARGIPLASNQIQYSLLHRTPEQNGVKKACDELDIKILAYSPLAQGALTGKYNSGNLPKGPRAAILKGRFEEVAPLLAAMREIGERHGNKTPSQVALNWLICKNTIPIPGARNAQQAIENAGAMGWRMAPEEVARLDQLSDNMNSFPGMPLAHM